MVAGDAIMNDELHSWKHFTDGKHSLIKGFGPHAEMLMGKYGLLNLKLIKKIQISFRNKG